MPSHANGATTKKHSSTSLDLANTTHLMLRPRLLLIFLCTVLALAFLAWVRDDIVRLSSTVANKLKWNRKWQGGELIGPGPDYRRFVVAEQSLPQHNLDLPFPEGRTGRYVKFANQMQRIGWNDVLSEL